MTQHRYRLVALDMDGTLLNSDHESTSYTREVVRRAAEAGYIVVLSTGRCLSELRRHLKLLPGVAYIIGENGAWIYDVRRRQSIESLTLDDEEVDYILRAAEGLDFIYQVYVDNQSYMQFDADEALIPYHIYDFMSEYRSGSRLIDDIDELCRQSPGRVEKINLYFSTQDHRGLFVKRMAGRPVAMADSIAIGIEISPLAANKGRGLKALCDHLGLPLSDTIAVGDGGNDIDIMRAAGLAVAMKNATEPVKAVADVCTDDCDHEGAAHAIEKYLLAQ